MSDATPQNQIPETALPSGQILILNIIDKLFFIARGAAWHASCSLREISKKISFGLRTLLNRERRRVTFKVCCAMRQNEP